MSVSTISSKGQITLPADIRKKLGMKPHDRVFVESTDEAIIIRSAKNLFDLKGFAGPAKSPDEEQKKMTEAIANHQAGE